MLTYIFRKHKLLPIFLSLGILLTVLAACDTNGSSSTNSTATPSILTSASALMKHDPAGTLQLSWDSTTHVLTVQVALTGLAPDSVHPTRLYEGSCRQPGKEVYPLKDTLASNIGFANEITTINDVNDGIPANGWFVALHNGPGLANNPQALSIACADIVNPTTSTTANQSVVTSLGSTFAADQNVTGNAQLAVNNGGLTVTVTLHDLVPHSTHMLHIHTGSCASQGKVVYSLKSVVANASGVGTSTTVIPGVASIPDSGWYINAHLGPSLNTQTGFDPIACGDIAAMQ